MRANLKRQAIRRIDRLEKAIKFAIKQEFSDARLSVLKYENAEGVEVTQIGVDFGPTRADWLGLRGDEMIFSEFTVDITPVDD